MANKYTEAQKKASLKYQQNKAQIKITVDKEQRDRYQLHAERKNTNLTALITNLLDKDMEESDDTAKYT